MVGRRRKRVEPTEEWGQLELLLKWPEQREYELIRPIVVFGGSVAERARETGAASESKLRRDADLFDEVGMPSLFGSEPAKRQRFPLAMRRLIVDRKAEYPPFSLGELARICYVAFGRRPSKHTVKRVLQEGPTPLMPVRRYPSYHEMPGGRKRREAIVELHADGWTVKSIAGFLETSETTVYRTLKRWAEEGVEGLEDKPRGRPKGSGKTNFPIMNTVRRMQENPKLGAFRVHAALKQVGIHLSRATCGRIMAANRRVYGLEKPRGGARAAPKQMPFASERLHEYWSADVRYIDTPKLSPGGQVYVVSVLENHSRAILASGVFRTQNLSSFLSVFYQAIERYGSPGALVTDSGSVFGPPARRPSTRCWAWITNGSSAASRGKISRKRRSPSRRGWPIITSQKPRAGPSSSRRTMGGLTTTTGRSTRRTSAGRMASTPQYRCWDGSRRCATTPRTSDGLSSQAASPESLTTSATPASATGACMGRRACRKKKPRCGWSPRASRWSTAGSRSPVTTYGCGGERGTTGCHAPEAVRDFLRASPQLRLFALDSLGDGGWLKALRLEGYAPRIPRRPGVLQQALFAYHEAWG